MRENIIIIILLVATLAITSVVVASIVGTQMTQQEDILVVASSLASQKSIELSNDTKQQSDEDVETKQASKSKASKNVEKIDQISPKNWAPKSRKGKKPCVTYR